MKTLKDMLKSIPIIHFGDDEKVKPTPIDPTPVKPKIPDIETPKPVKPIKEDK